MIPLDHPVTVVGGGLAGLVAARRIARTGRSVRLLEASHRLGGALARQRVGDIELDAGAESFSMRGGAVAALAAELGLGDQLVLAADQPTWVHTGSRGARPLPAAGVLGIPSVPLAEDVIGVAGMGPALRAQLDSLIPALKPRATTTLGEVVRRRMGAGVLRHLVTPATRAAFLADPHELLLDHAVPGLGHLLAGRGSLASAVRDLLVEPPALASIRGGVNRIVTELVADLVALEVDLQLERRIPSPDAVSGAIVWAAPLSEGPQVTLATLVLDAPELDSAPRGARVLVDPDARDVAARSLAHSTASWSWLAERAGGRHVVRLSYVSAPEELAELARRDAASILGLNLPASALVDFARVSWSRPTWPAPRPEGMLVVGESVAGPDIASVVASTNAAVDAWLASADDATE